MLIAAGAIFAAAEHVLLRLRRRQGLPPRFRGVLRHRIGARVMATLEPHLAASRLGFVLTTLALGWLGMPWLGQLATAWLPEGVARGAALMLAFALLAGLHLAFAQAVRRGLAHRSLESPPLVVLGVLHAFYLLSAPLIGVLNHGARLLCRLTGASAATAPVDEQELRALLTSGDDLPDDQRTLLDNVFKLSHRNARQAMVPRADVLYLNTEASIEDSLERARAARHTRLPLCNGDLDQVVGVVHVKDLFAAETPPASLLELVQPILFVPESLNLARLLGRMRDERQYFAAVVDEYGGVRGIVTIENIMEQLVGGEIDDQAPAPTPLLVPEGTGYRVAGTTSLADLATLLDTTLDTTSADTIGGIVLQRLGRIPEVGDSVEIGNLYAEVTAVANHRVEAIHLEVAMEAA
ncbi:MAG: hemolysin family protein [Acidobacteriota bacterium]